jgi:glycine oxidase
MAQRILVIGGGIIGMLTARELHAAGCRVTLVERQQPARESTWAGGGIVSPLFPWRYLDAITTLATWSQAVYPELSETLHADTGIDPEFTRNGMLMVADDELQTALDWAYQHTRHLELIDRQTFAELEPQAAHPPERGLWMPEVGQIRNPRLGKALQADLLRRGIELLTDTPVTGLLREGDTCRAVQTAQGNLEADQVLICAGSWSGGLLGGLPTPPDIRPVRGQMLLFKTEPGTISRITLEAQRYIIPRRDGHVLFGSSMEEVGFDKSTTEEMREELQALVCERFPVMCDAPLVKHWAGLRPGSPAGVPYIARHPEIGNLFVNAGQYRNGVVLAPASARLAADLMLERTPILDPTPYGWTAARG